MDGAGSDSSIIYVGVFQDGLKDGKLKIGRRILNECTSRSNLGTGSVLSGGPVSKRNSSVSVKYLGRVWRRRGGEGGGWDTQNLEIRILVVGQHRMEEFLDAVEGIKDVTSVVHRYPRSLSPL